MPQRNLETAEWVLNAIRTILREPQVIWDDDRKTPQQMARDFAETYFMPERPDPGDLDRFLPPRPSPAPASPS